jgi:hypothetical protein
MAHLDIAALQATPLTMRPYDRLVVPDFVRRPPHSGTLLVFRRSENSWRGHEPFQGQCRAIRMNWVTDKAVVTREQDRHRLSTTIKKLNPFRKAS